MAILNAGHLTDAQARNLAIKAIRQARAAHRKADTAGEKLEREFDRLIKRKTRINAQSLVTASNLYLDLLKLTEQMQTPLSDANYVASQF